ncbi:Major facilitator superfamily domain, general substrate transporter [Metarhizium album ARSEF 1941]|uniref:Major facilitator superfamily domain, general substrate transporter n=1 Tax=Metarhizium album (strain ARSEF 1941) TaxID=1081103 RepID=A0A0B2WU75_METAS|nr:Major facilitator superfamily domain, general substrate transporter [Metarhizium album ARSEF 1941]KHN97618.1 Major facilitator superfamily domain, general substrate transporter [Metarhizium album ARSEF 1941]
MEDKQRAENNDIESAQPSAATTDTDSPKDGDANLVAWAPSDPEHPRNWPRPTKWKTTLTVSLFVFVSPISSAMIAPALEDLGRSLDMKGSVEVYLSMSIFILAYAVGPIVFGPASELYGRVAILHATNLWYLVWNLACGFANTKAELFVFRFLAGIGGSAPLAVGGGAVSDMWSPEERGKAMSTYTMAPMLGPVVGPIAGAFIAQYSTWRWVFYSTSAAAAVVQAVGLPIVACIAVYMAYLFGTLYLMFATFPDVWTGVYGQPRGVAGLNYLSIAVGCIAGVLLQLGMVDRVYGRLKRRNGGVGRPEFRLPSLAVGSVLLTVGLFWYAWSIGRAHWIVPDLGALLCGAGVICCLQGMQMYIVDCYQVYAASAMAACAVLRSLAGFAFPLFASYMYEELGYGWGTSLLAFVSIGIGWVAPVVFWVWGPKLRAMSKFAAG